MSIQQWSDNVILVEITDDPQLMDDIDAVVGMVTERTDQDVVMDFRSLPAINSSNISGLLRLRKRVVISNGRKLHLCAVNTQIWGVFLTTGLDKHFDFFDDLAMGLASVHM